MSSPPKKNVGGWRRRGGAFSGDTADRAKCRRLLGETQEVCERFYMSISTYLSHHTAPEMFIDRWVEAELRMDLRRGEAGGDFRRPVRLDYGTEAHLRRQGRCRVHLEGRDLGRGVDRGHRDRLVLRG